MRSAERTINGIRLITQSIPSMRALILWARLGKIAAPALVTVRDLDHTKAIALVKALDKGIEEIDVASVGNIFLAIGPALSELLAALAPQIDDIARELLFGTIAIRDGAKYELTSDTNINAAFDDDIGALILACWWVGTFNFQAFRKGSRASSVAAPAKDSRSTSAT